MGDITDDDLDRMLFGGRRGWSTDDDDPDDEYHPPKARCNRCGSADVRWRQQTGKWVLFNLGVGKHVCKIDDSAFSATEP